MEKKRHGGGRIVATAGALVCHLSLRQPIREIRRGRRRRNRNTGVEGDEEEEEQRRVCLKLSGALMCLCPAESKEIENLSVVPGGLQGDTCRRNKQGGQRDGG